MGSVMGTMLWKACKTIDVDIFIQTATLRDFLALSNNTFKSFISTYKNNQLPDLDTDEFKFFMSIGGTITNISAQKAGRDYILNEKVGIQLLDSILNNFNDIQMTKGKILKR